MGEIYIQSPLRPLPLAGIPSPAGSTRIELSVPPEPLLVGRTFYAQAAILGQPAQMTGYLSDTFGQ